ncbi:MAG: carbamoyl transferase [bacterium]|nr:carbamoyl transferase [bacterium]
MTGHKNVLSLYWGICSGAALIQDGAVVAAVSEERFTRLKNDDAFPRQAIEWCLNYAGVEAKDLEYVAVASHHQDYFHQLTRPALWTVDNYIEEQHRYWKPRLLEKKDVDYAEQLSHLVDRDQYPQWYWRDGEGNAVTFPSDRKKIVARFLNIDEKCVHTAEHHTAHAFYAYHASKFREKPVLALTVDASGDGANATIGVFDEQGRYERLFQTYECFIARFYRYLTLVLGMKPNEHEYKLMGLAPYGKEKHSQKALKVFRETLYVDGIEFKWNIKPTDSYFWFKDKLEGQRFDNIAWALQTWVEEMLAQWVQNAVERFGVSTVIFSGGVAMNIKAMGRLASLPGVTDFFVPGSAADESLAIGAGLCIYDQQFGFKNNCSASSPPAVSNLYLGPDFDRRDEENALNNVDLNRYDVITEFDDQVIVERLLAGDVIGRCCGRMEFGQRALGNRSLLADPSNPQIKEKINSMIKSRDFWMPFAPIMLDSFVERYLCSPRVESYYMTIGFDTTAEGYEMMRSACHPADKTARAQILTKSMNPSMYGLLNSFADITGRGALLNTSFNIHGEPIISGPDDAVDVLNRSSLDGLLLKNYLILLKR